MNRVTDKPVVLFNPHLTCKLCGGYLIDATTIVECLHSFCRTCILTYLKVHTTCPICETLLHKTRPHYAIRPDRVLQAIVYKLIPNLFEKEMLYRRKFYKDHPPGNVRSLSPEKRGETTLSAYVSQEDDRYSIELLYVDQHSSDSQNGSSCPGDKSAKLNIPSQSTYLLCPSDLTVGHLEKLIRMKFNLRHDEHDVVIFFNSDDFFSPDFTMSDLACIYVWHRQNPLKLCFTIKSASKPKEMAINKACTVPCNKVEENDTVIRPAYTMNTSPSSKYKGEHRGHGSCNSDNSLYKKSSGECENLKEWEQTSSSFYQLPCTVRPISPPSLLKGSGSVCSPRA